MGSNGVNIAQVQRGFDLVGNVVNTFSPMTAEGGVDSERSAEIEEIARMKEFVARQQAHAERRQARVAASDIRKEKEAERAREHANWGRSGLAASGSRSLVQTGNRLDDKQTEDDVLFQGDLRAQETASKGVRDANLFRISKSRPAKRSTLSLGSKLYDPWR